MLCDEKKREEILSRLSGYRLSHTLGCEKAAVALAERWGADCEKCAFAMLIHDITKGFSCQQQLNLCEKYDIIPSDIEKSEWKLLHGKTAAAIALDEFGAPKDVADAVACHTTGKVGMTLIDKIVYLADYIEETRDFDGVERARELAFEDIDQALIYCFNHTIGDLMNRDKLINMDTVSARNNLLADRILKDEKP